MKITRTLFIFVFLINTGINTFAFKYEGWSFSVLKDNSAEISYITENKSSLNIPSSVYESYNGWHTVKRFWDGIFSKKSNNWKYINTAKTASIPSTIINMGDGTFQNNDVIESVIVKANIDIPTSTFEGCTSLKTVSWKSPTIVGDYAFYNCIKLSSMSHLGLNVKKYASHSFYKSGLESFDFGPKTQEIGPRAFENVTKPTMLLLPNSLSTISPYAFAKCSSLSLISFGNGSVSVGANAFENCSSLKFLIIGNGMKSIGSMAFKDCANIREIYIDATIPPVCEIGAFEEEVKKNAMLYVPLGTFADYWSSPEWEDFNIVERKFEPIDSIQTAESFIIIKDTRVRLPFIIHPTSASIPNLIFSSSNSSVAHVASDGFVEGLKAGTSIVTISTLDGTNITKQIEVIVKEPEITDFNITPKSIVLAINQQASLNINVKPDNTDKSVAWSSCNNEIAVVKEKDGGEVIVLARAIGETDVIATSLIYPEVTDSCHITVVDEDIFVGDINEDGYVNKTDLDVLIDILLNRKESMKVADINRDDKVDGLDFVILSKMIMKSR